MVPFERQVEVLARALVTGRYTDLISDGRRRWAVLFNFEAQGAATIFPDHAGAIVHFEEGIAQPWAVLYRNETDLLTAWHGLFAAHPQTLAASC
jgi:hypothetical protein